MKYFSASASRNFVNKNNYTKRQNNNNNKNNIIENKWENNQFNTKQQKSKGKAKLYESERVNYSLVG